MFSSKLEDAIEIIVEADPNSSNTTTSTSNSPSPISSDSNVNKSHTERNPQPFTMTGSGVNKGNGEIQCRGVLDSDVFEAGSAVTGHIELLMISNSDVLLEAEQDVTIKMAIIVNETIFQGNKSSITGNTDSSLSLNADPSSSAIKSEEKHTACEVVIADRVTLNASNPVEKSVGSVSLPLYVLLPRLYTCPTFAVGDICRVTFQVQISMIVHDSQILPIPNPNHDRKVCACNFVMDFVVTYKRAE